MARRRTTSMPRIKTTLLKGFSGKGMLWINGHPVAEMDLQREDMTLRISYVIGKGKASEQEVDETIDLEETPCHYGGSRTWLSCPKCGRRKGVLYLGPFIACRECLRLTYPCSADRLQRGWCLYHRWHMEKKPKRMRWRTFHARNEKAARIAEGILVPFIRMMHDKLYG